MISFLIGLVAIVAGILLFAKSDANGFSVLRRYFSWSNECLAVFAFTVICFYMIRHGMPYGMAMLPGAFDAFVISSYLLGARIASNRRKFYAHFS